MRAARRLRSWEQLTRGRTALAASWLLLSGAWHGRGVWWAPRLGSMALSIFSCVVFAQTVNDVVDLDADRRSGRDRPLVVGAISLRGARAAAAAAALAALASSSVAGPGYLATTVVLVAVSGLYSSFLRTRTRWGMVLVALCAAAPVLIGAELGGRLMNEFTLFLLVFFYMCSFELAKDVRDIDQDTGAGYLSWPRSLGPRRSLRWCGLLDVLALASGVAVTLHGRRGLPFAVAFFALAGTCMVRSWWATGRSREPVRARLTWMRRAWSGGMLSLIVLVT